MNSINTNKRTFDSTKTLVMISLIAAIFCILGPLSLPLPFSPVPLTWTNLVILISVYILDYKYASLSYLIYLLLGSFGLPVFSGFSGGLAKFAGPTGGYLVGLLFLALISGFSISRFPRKKWLHAVSMIIGMLITYGFGTLWLSLQLDLTFIQGLATGVFPYIPGDIIKILLALFLGPIISKRLRPLFSQI